MWHTLNIKGKNWIIVPFLKGVIANPLNFPDRYVVTGNACGSYTYLLISQLILFQT